MSEQTASTTPIPKRRRRRTIRILGLLAILLAALIVAAPWVMAHTVLFFNQRITAPLSLYFVTGYVLGM